MGLLSDIASIVTVLLFVLYTIGHIYKIKQIQYSLSERYQFERDFDNEGPKPNHYFELSNVGSVFSISSQVGIKEISIYDVNYSQDNNTWAKGDLKGRLVKIKSNEKAYIKVDVPDLYEGCFIELVKCDGIKISFGVALSGYNGSFVQTQYSLKMTLKSWVNYMCS